MSLVLLTIFNYSEAQQKYAVLVAGDYLATNVPAEDKWNGGDDPGIDGYYEFWNDCYLIWETLLFNKEYESENVNVLFADKVDYYINHQWVDIRYRPQYHDMQNVSDDFAAKSVLAGVFTNLANTMDDDDFLFVWIMSHGGYDENVNNGSSYIYLRDYTNGTNELLYDYELKTMLDPINSLKQVVFVHAPHSGNFTEELADPDRIILASCGIEESAQREVELDGQVFRHPL